MATQSQTTPPLHRLDIDTYNRIIASGALEGQRVELLDGLIVDMSPHSPRHSLAIDRLMRHLAMAPRWWTRVQMPLEVRPDSALEPDLAVLEAEPPAGAHPHDALLVIEVAVSSQLIDRNVKAPRYAQAAIPTFWLVDVPGRTVEVRTKPSPNGYGNCNTYREGMLVPSPLQDVEDLDVGALLAGL